MKWMRTVIEMRRYWPAIYLIDKQGVIRYVRVGEGGYRDTERRIQHLLMEDLPAK